MALDGECKICPGRSRHWDSLSSDGCAFDRYGKKKIERVFRDQEELPIGSDLADNIKQALAESEFLIIICSPRTPEFY